MQTTNYGGADVNLFLPEEELEPGALLQIIDTSIHPHVLGPVAVMPDVHQGYGVTIGTIFQTGGVIVPNAVGVDIGCGVAYVNTGIKFEHIDEATFREIDWGIRQSIPVGFNWHDKAMTRVPVDPSYYKYANHPQRVDLQYGTLGGGNHFIELLADDETGYMWAAVHSGSRGFGNNMAERFQALAIKENAGGSKDLESLSLESEAGQLYYDAMKQACDYAKGSREWMLNTVRNILKEDIGPPAKNNRIMDICHNYAEVRNDIVTHRKGAVDANEGRHGIIPGSMGSNTYVTRGLGNPDSIFSSSHGAGRTMSRGQAKKNFTLEEFQASLSGTYSTATTGTIDESPMAYKNIDLVIERQADCIAVEHILRPILTIKGGGRDEG